MILDIPLTIFVVDDDPASRDGLTMLLETAGHTIECHESAESFLSTFNPQRIGCLILDVRMQKMSGLELQEALNKKEAHLPIIFLTAHGDIPMTVRAMKDGAFDFLTKPVNGAQLLDLVDNALQKAEAMAQASRCAKIEKQKLSLLTPREQQVMTLALAGHSNKAIAKQLGISFRTVEIHRSHILQKTGVANMLELAQIAANSPS